MMGGITDEQGEAWLRARLKQVLSQETRTGGDRWIMPAVALDGGELRWGTGYRWRILGDWHDAPRRPMMPTMPECQYCHGYGRFRIMREDGTWFRNGCHVCGGTGYDVEANLHRTEERYAALAATEEDPG